MAVPSAAAAGVPEVFGDDWWVGQPSALDLGLATIVEPDGAWTYALAEGFDVKMVVHDRVVDWVYAGQHRFGTDLGDDIAVIDHVANWVIHQDWLELGYASDDALENTYGELSTVGYPGTKPNCAANSGAGGILDAEVQNSAYLYRQVAGIQDTPGERLQMYADGGPGQSGSPYFYCIGGCYDDADTGLLAGVWSSWNPLTTNRTACKTNDKNTWLLGEL